MQKAKLGPNHPDTLTSMNNLANSYAALGRHADALKLCRQTAAMWEKLNRADAASHLLPEVHRGPSRQKIRRVSLVTIW